MRGLGSITFLLICLARTLWASDTAITVLVLKEHGVSGASYAQPYVDKFIQRAADVNGWAEASGQYLSKRDEALKYLQSTKPTYGIFSLDAFLALRQEHQLKILGQVSASLVGGQQYFLISKAVADLAGCKGKSLATDHADDTRFIERVVAAGQFKLKDFELVATQRPLQTIRKVVGGEAVCALVDDAQLAELVHLEGASAVRPVWSSAKLPPMVLAAFPKAREADRKRFQDNLAKLCDGDGKQICEEVGIQALRAASEKDYAAVTAAYGKER